MLLAELHNWLAVTLMYSHLPPLTRGTLYDKSWVPPGTIRTIDPLAVAFLQIPPHLAANLFRPILDLPYNTL